MQRRLRIATKHHHATRGHPNPPANILIGTLERAGLVPYLLTRIATAREHPAFTDSPRQPGGTDQVDRVDMLKENRARQAVGGGGE